MNWSLSVDNTLLAIEGAVTLQSVSAADVRRFQRACGAPGLRYVSWANAHPVDSAAVAMIVAARRITDAAMQDAPSALQALLALYEVEEIVA